MTMDMNRFCGRYESVSANSGMEFADIPKLVVSNGTIVRLIGDFASVWEHFINTPKGPRPYYCAGPDSDCPMCRVANEMSFNGDPKLQEIGKNAKARERFFFNALDRSPAGKAWHSANRKSKLLTQNEKSLTIGSMLFKAIGDVVMMRQQQGQDCDPNTFDLMLSKTGSSMMTRYGAQFTGNTDPLTDEELAYEIHPLNQIAKVSPQAELETGASFIVNGGGVDESPSENSGAVGPVQVAQSLRTASPTVRQNAPNQRPVGFPPPAIAPGQNKSIQVKQNTAKPAVEIEKIKLKPQAATQKQKHTDPKYQDTTPVAGADESVHMTIPCASCGSDMMFSLEDERDIMCHSCGKIYENPAKS